MSNRIGIIAEDKSDVDVLRMILLKYVKDDSFCIKKIAAGGCGKLRRKCAKWASMLKQMGCNHLFVIHDLDERDEEELRRKLETLLSSSAFVNALVVIPTKEMEAWLLSDSAAIKNTFNLKGKVKITTNVEMIDNPKERLRDLIWKKGKKRYLNTVHNKKIANIISLKALRKCESFKPLDVYIKRYLRAN
jgi:uncharacterized protein DUF4276